MSDDVFYITTPIYYVNDVPHLGHAYTSVAADFIARWQRLSGRSVYFLTGTDEHGEKVLRTARDKGLSPTEWTDQIVPRWAEVWKALDIGYDDFIRTTEARHEGPVQTFVQELHHRGEVYLGSYEGLYCVGCEAFKQPDELVDGRCPLHPNRDVETVKEDNYFFRLSKYRDRLIDLYEGGTFVMPEPRRNEVLGKVRKGLDDLSISRVSFDWGIQVPWDPKHVIYVWIDALLNYVTAIGYGSDQAGFERVWPASVHLVGKDILWFHSVIWPAMLMALDIEVPRRVFAHGYLQVGGAKMSKSTLTGISPHDLLETFGSDGFRHFFMREVSFGQDGNFSWEAMAARYNSDLANDFGNLASRVLSMIERYLDGRVPAPPAQDELESPDRSLMRAHGDALEAMGRAMESLVLTDALKESWRFVRRANAYVEEVAPWALAKDEGRRRRLEVVLYLLADALRLMAIQMSPIIPRAAEELWGRLGLQGAAGDCTLEPHAVWGLLPAESVVQPGPPLFPRIEDQTS